MPESIIIELAGLPAAGKTSAAELLSARLRDRRVTCEVIEEAAQHNPLQALKCEWPFNVWSSCHMLMRLLEVQAADSAQVIIVDRGLLDAQCWMLWFKQRREIDAETYAALRTFLRAPAWAASTSVVVELQVGFETALERRSGDTGRIFNSRTFRDLSRAYELTCLDQGALHPKTELIRIDTNGLPLAKVVERIENLLPERLPCLPPTPV
jgi:thymidylate kinase